MEMFNLSLVSTQPNPSQKFTYPSLLPKKSKLECEYNFCYDTILPKILIVIDLYSQQNPPLLSQHILLNSESKKMGSKRFVVDVMEQVDADLSYYKYVLKDVHIQLTSNKRRKEIIKDKLRELKKFQLSFNNLTAQDMELIENTISIDYSEDPQEKKAYLGFTPYFDDPSTQQRIKLAETTFSQSIYDCSN